MGFFDKKETDETIEQQVSETANDEKVIEMPKRRPYALWEVGDREFKLKLPVDGIQKLEAKYKTNLMNIMGTGNGGMPALTVMLDVAHEAMKKFNHGVSRTDVNDIFERYLDEGGSQLNFYTEIYMNIFQVSGFFSDSLTNQMEDAMEDVKDIL